MKKETFSVRNKKGEKIVGDLFNPEQESNKVIILIHGYSSHRNSSTKRLVELLLQEGKHCISFDCSGCGESEGELGKKTISDWVEDTIAIIAWAKIKGYKHIALVGGSVGGGIALGVCRQETIERLFLRCPSSNYALQREEKMGKEWIENWRVKGIIFKKMYSGPDKEIEYSMYENALKNHNYHKKDTPKVPTLIIHGDKDMEVPLRHSEILVERMQNATLAVIKGAGHALDVDGDFSESEQYLLDWFAEW